MEFNTYVMVLQELLTNFEYIYEYENSLPDSESLNVSNRQYIMGELKRNVEEGLERISNESSKQVLHIVYGPADLSQSISVQKFEDLADLSNLTNLNGEINENNFARIERLLYAETWSLATLKLYPHKIVLFIE